MKSPKSLNRHCEGVSSPGAQATPEAIPSSKRFPKGDCRVPSQRFKAGSFVTRNDAWIVILLFSSTIFLSSCQHHHAHYHFTGVPELKQRNVMLIDPVAEWDQIQTRFANLERDVRKNPSDAESKIQLADLYMNEARVTGEEDYYTSAALHVLDEVLESDLKKDEKNPKNDDIKFRALTMKAFVLASLHQFNDALETGKQAIAINSNNSLIYGVMVDANVELGNYDEAVKMCEKMMDLRPDLRSYSRASYMREIHGDIEGAIEAMKLAVSAGAPGQEQTAWTRVMLGKLYENYGDLSNEEAQYGFALLERPNYPHAIAGMARIKTKNSDFENAEKLFKKAIELMPSAEFYEELALLYKRNGQKEKEQKAIEQAMHEMNHHHHHSSNVGLENAYLHLRLKNDYDAALKCMKDEVKMRPENIEVNKVMAWAYYGKGDFKKAEAYLQQARKTNSQDTEMLCIAGMIKIKNGQEQEGEALLQKSFEYNPYLADGLKAEAESYLAKL